MSILQKDFVYSSFLHLMKFNIISKEINIQHTDSFRDSFRDETQNLDKVQQGVSYQSPAPLPLFFFNR